MNEPLEQEKLEPSAEGGDKPFLTILFCLLVLMAGGIIGWKFFGSQEQPMENKILYVFSTFVFCSIALRWIAAKAKGGFLQRWVKEALEWSDTGVSAVFLAFLIMAFVLQAFKIPSGSMQPTLLIGDHLFVNKFIYGIKLPFTMKEIWDLKEVRHQDVVVFLCPPSALSEEERVVNLKKDFIKRAVGLPGDKIEIRNKILYINDKEAPDPFASLTHPAAYPKPNFWANAADYQSAWEKGEFVYLPLEAVRDNFGPVQVPAGHYFVMGDNRDGSFDSRFWGPLPEKYLKGKAWLVYWPFNRFHNIR